MFVQLFIVVEELTHKERFQMQKQMKVGSNDVVAGW
jgi:hypothetical protein